MLQLEATGLAGVLVVAPRRVADARGWFEETWSRAALAEAGVTLDWVQDNQALSRAAGTVRGLHGQAPPAAQAKLVRVAAGAILDVAVDARPGSATFGRWVGVELSAANGRQLLIPEGFLHGYATREPGTVVAYRCSAPYAPALDGGVAWDDPDLGIDWGVAPGAAILSDRDRALPRWRDWRSPFAAAAA